MPTCCYEILEKTIFYSTFYITAYHAFSWVQLFYNTLSAATIRYLYLCSATQVSYILHFKDKQSLLMSNTPLTITMVTVKARKFIFKQIMAPCCYKPYGLSIYTR